MHPETTGQAPESDTFAIRLQAVEKRYRIYHHPSDRLKQSLVRGRKHYFTEHVALQPLTLEIARGQTVGVIGVNGSGKSTLLQLITRTLSPSGGTIEVHGRVSALLELGAGFNPEFSGEENVYLNGSIMGLSRQEIAARYDDIVAFSGLPLHMLSQPVKTYSSGMYVRLAFAVAIAVEPDILIVDEALAVGDEGFQRKCFARIRALQEGGATILFVSHSARTIVDLCDYALLLDAGELLMEGAPADIVAAYHKMLFAREEDRPAIRSEIAQQQPVTPHPALKISAPESRMEYVPDGGRIADVVLLDAAGQETRVLIMGESYQLRYRVLCEREMQSLKCSMMLKTMTGIELAGALGTGDSDSMVHVAEGQVLDVCFEFRCSLIKGDYFINVGVVEEQFGTYRFVHRIIDALHIKVQDAVDAATRPLEPRGFVDIGITASLSARNSNIHRV
jgi:lipopolysaccharide transport system ATP-binding protein